MFSEGIYVNPYPIVDGLSVQLGGWVADRLTNRPPSWFESQSNPIRPLRSLCGTRVELVFSHPYIQSFEWIFILEQGFNLHFVSPLIFNYIVFVSKIYRLES